MRYDSINTSPGWSLKIAGNSNDSSESMIIPANGRAMLPFGQRLKRESQASNIDDSCYCKSERTDITRMKPSATLSNGSAVPFLNARYCGSGTPI